MPGGFNGAGTYVRFYNWTADAANAIPILASRFDTEHDGFAAGLSNCVTRDGQGKPTATIDWNAQRLTGLANASGATDALNQQYADTRYARYSDTTANFTGALQKSGVAVAVVAAGTFTGTLSGMSATTTGTIAYSVTGGKATLYLPTAVAITGTSISAFMAMTGLAAACQPSIARQVFCWVQDSIGIIAVQVTVSGSSLIFNPLSVSGGLVISNGSFTSSGTKGLPATFALEYPL